MTKHNEANETSEARDHDWLTIKEMSTSHGISCAKISYWVKRLAERGQARKTGPTRRDVWLVHVDAVEFLKVSQKAGRKVKEVSAEMCERLRSLFVEKRSVQGVADSLTERGVSWQTAARLLSKCGIRPYTSPKRKKVK